MAGVVGLLAVPTFFVGSHFVSPGDPFYVWLVAMPVALGGGLVALLGGRTAKRRGERLGRVAFVLGSVVVALAVALIVLFLLILLTFEPS